MQTRNYEKIIKEHITKYSQMIFIAGPRQVGKTTLAKKIAKDYPDSVYLNWDDKEDRQLILSGQKKTAQFLDSKKLKDSKKIIIFDEIHKYKKWKSFLKGFFDSYNNEFVIIVTGSAKLNVYKSGGDSLMGRYFLYRLHPLSIYELIQDERPISEYVMPCNINNTKFNNLINFGGYPEPFLKKDKIFSQRWKNLRMIQLFQEDIRNLTKVQEIHQMEILAELLINQSGQLTNYTNLANKINVTVKTIQNWISILNATYFCFTLKPWSKNISRSLKKEPKIYLWDWSYIKDKGSKLENFTASHLLKAVHYWTDTGLGAFDLFFIRDKDKKEVDFVVTKDNEPWFLVETKASVNTDLSSSLIYYSKKLNIKHAFQVVFDMEYVNKDCFSVQEPVKVPAQSFFSQLV